MSPIPPRNVSEAEPIPINAVVTVAVSSDKRTAALFVTPPKNGGLELTRAQLDDAIAKTGVCFGVDENILSQMVSFPTYNAAVVFAKAKLPVDGKDGYIEFHFSTERTRTPQIRADGTVDYKELGNLPNVRKGDELCTLHKGKPGKPGINVLGAEIPPKPGKTPRLTPGRNTVMDEDGIHLLSQMDGQVSVDGRNRIAVQNTYTVEGDVDVSTGNITFVGNVEVLGSILSGYTVRAEGSVTVRGYVEGGSIYSGGSVNISDGYLGNPNSEIVCGGNLRCKHVHHGRVSVEGNLETGRLFHSEIRCGGSVKMQGTHSTIIGGKLFVRYEVDCHDVGSRMSGAETRIEVGSDPVVSTRAAAIPVEEKQLDKRISDVERVHTLLKQLHDLGRLSPERMDEYEKVSFTLETLKERRVALYAEREIIREKMLTVGYGTVIIRRTAYPGVTIIIGPEMKKLQEEVYGVRFQRTKEGIETAPAGK